MRDLFVNSGRAWQKSRDAVRQQGGWKFFVLTVAVAAFALLFGRPELSGWPFAFLAAVAVLFAFAWRCFHSPVTALTAALLGLCAAIWPIWERTPWFVTAPLLVLLGAVALWSAPRLTAHFGWQETGEAETGDSGRRLALAAAIGAVVGAAGFAAAGILFARPYPAFGIPVALLLWGGIDGWYSLLQWKFDRAAWRLVLALAAFLALLRIFLG